MFRDDLIIIIIKIVHLRAGIPNLVYTVGMHKYALQQRYEKLR